MEVDQPWMKMYIGGNALKDRWTDRKEVSVAIWRERGANRRDVGRQGTGRVLNCSNAEHVSGVTTPGTQVLNQPL